MVLTIARTDSFVGLFESRETSDDAGSLISDSRRIDLVEEIIVSLIAILVGRFGFKLKLVAYTTNSASLMIRDIGLVLFLASVGIKAGGNFLETVMNGGLSFVLYGFIITIVPILIVGIIMRAKYKQNYFYIMGLIAGATTDPPALAYSTATANNDVPSIAYSTVYPLSMFLRIVSAQMLILIFCT